MKDDILPPYETTAPAAPLYEQVQSRHDDGNDNDDDNATVEPTIFILAGQAVYAETVDGPPAYELSRAVATLTKSTEKVEFERLDQILSAAGPADDLASSPTIRRPRRPRRRHLYDLRRTPKQPRLGLARSRARSDAPEYYLHSQSLRRTLGHVGLAKARPGGWAAGFRAMPVHVAGGATSRARFFTGDGGGGEPLFALRRDKGGRSRWVVVAADGEETLAIEDAADRQRRLILTRALPRKEVDALVALWCASIWQEAAARADKELRGVKDNSSAEFHSSSMRPALHVVGSESGVLPHGYP
ncbi:hypothetical protein G3M48_000559 [Beauveria asiatica]|uniref:Uncharacterized protein n=1 Tax=Beauveria asiatica TaxID=1069075 RepID=A0AAW0RGC1_9HYPO